MDEREIAINQEDLWFKTCARGLLNWKTPACSRALTKPVDPRTQMGALLWQARDRGLLFENLPGYPGWRCLGQAPGDVSLAPVAFGTTRDEMIPEFVRRTEKLGRTRLVETGPVQQKVVSATTSISPRCRSIRRAFATAGRLSVRG